jgi:hypothetical protein
VATLLLPGPKVFSVVRDDIGHRDYKIKFLVLSTTGLDGPAAVLQTPGLPLPYSWWIIGGDQDLWAWCKWNAEVQKAPGQEDADPITHWDVILDFTTKPPKEYCREVQVEDPLLEPIAVSGSFVKYTEQATMDRFGLPIVNSAFEQIRGPIVEFDKNRATVHIEYNVPQLLAEIVAPLINAVNGSTMWGLPPRTIKLSSWSWDRKYWGQCFVYYRWKFDFDIRFDTFDRNVLDEGTKVLNGHWGADGHYHLDNIGGFSPNPFNPQHFKRFQDRAGNVSRVILNGQGLPAGEITGTGTVNPGSGARAKAVMSSPDGSGTVTSVTVTSKGSGYTVAPTVVFIGGAPAREAAAVAVISGGKVTQVNVVDQGNNYISQPNIGFETSGAGATGPPGNINVQYYPEDTSITPLGFLGLGLPTTF